MAKQRIRGGEFLDIPDVTEIGDVVKRHFDKALSDHSALFRVEYRTVAEQFYVDGAGNLNTNEYLNPNTNNDGNAQLGPAAGFAWDVKRLTVVAPTGATGTVGIFQNGNQPSNMVDPGQLPTYVRLWSSQQFVMRPNETIWLVGSGLVVNSIITLTGLVKEIPLDMIGRLNV